MALDVEDYLNRHPAASHSSGPSAKGEGQKRGLHILLVLGPAAAQGLDAYSTQQALHRGGVEGNSLMEPFVHNPGAMYATKLAAGLGSGLLANEAAKHGHRTLGKIISALGMAIPLAAAVHNSLYRHGQ